MRCAAHHERDPFATGSWTRRSPREWCGDLHSPTWCPMRTTATIGSQVLDKMSRTRLRSWKASSPAPRWLGRAGRALARNPAKYIGVFPPRTGAIWSFGSWPTAATPLWARRYALRIASAIAHDEGWLAVAHAHPQAAPTPAPLASSPAALPSACGKTNFAVEPTVPGGRPRWW
ncbi:hypothetical protein QJS66_17395 [Kocuria rhizophila]|nr:hypothetical protein QJS66_17395 [Kocuria rhizophila]